MNKATKDNAIEGEVITDNSQSVKSSKKTKPTFKQSKFAKSYIEGDTMGNATKSAIKAGYSEASAHVQGSVLLKNPKVLAILNKNVDQAEQTIIDIMNDGESDAVRLAAARELMDRTIGKPIQRSISAHVNITPEDMLNS